MGIKSRITATAVILLTTTFLMPWEGKKNYAYLDTIAKPHVWTVCYGETDPKYAYKGAYYTDKQCHEMLVKRVTSFYEDIARIADVNAIPVSVQASLLELLYNIGFTQFKTSTILKLANQGKYAEACLQLDRWVKAGGVTVRGLVNRRNASEEMCKRDL